MPAPANDLCSGATVIAALPFTDAALDTTAATVSGDDPSNSAYGGVPFNSVWYTWTAGSTAPVIVDTEGSDYDTLLAVYTGTCGGPFVEIASNDDDPGSMSGVTSKVAFTPVNGTTYFIVATSFGSAGLLTLNMALAPPPPNPPTGLTATSVPFDISIGLSWTAPASGSTPDGYDIQRCTGGGCSGFVTVASVGAGVTTYTNSNLTQGTLYRYQVLATLSGSGSSSASNIDQATTATASFAAGTRNSFTVGWWEQTDAFYIANGVIEFVGRVNSVDVVRVRTEPGSSGGGVQDWTVRTNSGATTDTVTFGGPVHALPRTTFDHLLYQVRVACSTYDTATNRFNNDATVAVIRDGVTITAFSGITISAYSALDEITTKFGAVVDKSRVWLAKGVAPITVDADGYPDPAAVTYYDDFSTGLGAWTAYAANVSGGVGALPTVHASGGAVDGPCISVCANLPSDAGSTGLVLAFVGIQRTDALVAPVVAPPVFTPPAAGPPPSLPTPCCPTTPSTTPLTSPTPNAGGNQGGMTPPNATPCYAGLSGAVPVGSDPVDQQVSADARRAPAVLVRARHGAEDVIVAELIGLACPVRVWRDDPATGIRSRFAAGCFTDMINAQGVELQVDHVWHEHLASQRHGLQLWEGAAGLFFRASIIARTAFSRSIVEGVRDGRIKHLCLGGGDSLAQTHDDGRHTTHRILTTELSLLVEGPPCFTSTWITLDGPAAQARILTENIDAAAVRLTL